MEHEGILATRDAMPTKIFLEQKEISPLKSWGVPLPAIWLLLEEGRVTFSHVRILNNIFLGYRCYAWCVSEGWGGSDAVKKVKRAFGDWPTLRKLTAVKAETRFGNDLFYCDIAEINASCEADLAEISNWSLWGKTCGIFLARTDVDKFPDELLALCRTRFENAIEDRRSESELLLQKYLASAVATDCIPVLVAKDSDMRQFLIAPTGHHLSMNAELDNVAESDFQAWLKIGIDLSILS